MLGYGYLLRRALTHGFAAAARAHRGRGAVAEAGNVTPRHEGSPALRTATEVRLAQMRALNTRLGYRPLYEEIVLRGRLAS